MKTKNMAIRAGGIRRGVNQVRQGAAGVIGEFGKERLRLGFGEGAHGCVGKGGDKTLSKVGLVVGEGESDLVHM